MTQPEQISDVTFSHDSTRLLFTRCGGTLRKCAIHEYEIATGKLRYYVSADNEIWSEARYSSQGDWIVFAVTPIANGFRVLENTQLAIMRPDGKGLKTLTHSKGWKVAPSFSPSGKKIIYARAGKIRQSGKTPAADYDVYSLDLASGEERRLTNFKFFLISRPYYLSDDETFVFSAEFPRSFPGIPEDDRKAIEGRRNQLQQQFKENTIYQMKFGDTKIQPWIRFNDYSSHPMFAQIASKVVFKGRQLVSQKGYVYEYFEYREDGLHLKIVSLDELSTWSVDLSPDGKWLAFIVSEPAGTAFGRQRAPRKLILVETKNGTMRELTLPRDVAPIKP